VFRSVLSIALLFLAASLHSLPLCITGWAVYWVGDVLDGLVARILRLETRLGAVLDSTADRACMLALLVAVGVCVGLEPIGPAIFGTLFCLVDWPLSLMFLRFRLLGPNYFSLVSRPLYWLNWHPVAKALSGGALPLLMLRRETALLVSFDVCYAALKAFSLLHATRLPAAPAPMDADGFGCRPAHRRTGCGPETGGDSGRSGGPDPPGPRRRRLPLGRGRRRPPPPGRRDRVDCVPSRGGLVLTD
jgi:CDP-diacylglycerol--glycerol-3-phosphate 3-phosphatidyltransferase